MSRCKSDDIKYYADTKYNKISLKKRTADLRMTNLHAKDSQIHSPKI